MNEISKLRKVLLRIAYILTIFGSGGFGLKILIQGQNLTQDWMFSTTVGTGLYASVLLAFAVCGILGLFYPEKFISVLVLQLVYKSIWLAAVVLPNRTKLGETDGVMTIISVCIVFMICEIIAIPFRDFFKKSLSS